MLQDSLANTKFKISKTNFCLFVTLISNALHCSDSTLKERINYFQFLLLLIGGDSDQSMQNKDITEQNMPEMPLHNYEGSEPCRAIVMHVSSQYIVRPMLLQFHSSLRLTFFPFIHLNYVWKICLDLR